MWHILSTNKPPTKKKTECINFKFHLLSFYEQNAASVAELLKTSEPEEVKEE